MSWGRNRKQLRHLAAIILAAAGATAAAADVLVVRATGPSARNFRAGSSLADNAKITLQANDSLTLLDGRGTRTLRGPGTFTPSSPPQAAGRATAIAGAATARRGRIGAVRGVEAGSPRSIWVVDIAKSSTICLADPANVTLWRADASKPVTLTLAGQGGARQELDWAAGQATLEWPADLAIADGAAYTISWNGAPQPTSLKFRTLPSKPTGIEATAASLIKNGCEAQLDLLIETMKVPEGEPVPG
ncbi:MAG TPA: hypothetical protein VGW34_03525 [Allosphingosinicella sp.]|nr:hypothetical protein [Allosphingosinicella sp.]